MHRHFIDQPRLSVLRKHTTWADTGDTLELCLLSLIITQPDLSFCIPCPPPPNSASKASASSWSRASPTPASSRISPRSDRLRRTRLGRESAFACTIYSQLTSMQTNERPSHHCHRHQLTHRHRPRNRTPIRPQRRQSRLPVRLCNHVPRDAQARDQHALPGCRGARAPIRRRRRGSRAERRG